MGVNGAIMFRGNSSQEGGATIEFVIWMPVFVLVMSLIVDVSFLSLTQAQMWRVASSTSRFVAVGSKTEAEAKSYAEAQAQEGHTYVVSINDDGATVSTTISVPFSDAAITGPTKLFDYKLTVKVSQRKES